jgi:miniconductance mechanosensitive channel
VIEHAERLLESYGLSPAVVSALSWLAVIAGIILLAIISNYVAKRILLVAIHHFVKRTRTQWDDVLSERKVFIRLSHLAPALVLYISSRGLPEIQSFIHLIAKIYIVLIGASVWSAFLNSVEDIYERYDVSREKPIKSYMQIVKIVTYILVSIFVISNLIGQSPLVLLSGLGALSAVLLIIFKDSLLGLVASIQLSANNMIRRGDWIEMPGFGADGTVIDVSLHTIKVQNWDKTIVTVPTYTLIADSFKNWRGMEESGGRRIKRALNIDVSSIRFCTGEMLEKFEKYQLISDYIRKKRAEIEQYNREHDIDTSALINGRNLTNIGTFRAYIAAYLHNHPMIHDRMTFLVRHLPVTEKGLPIEIYVFSKDQAWANYEAIQADVFDHILAVVPLFELRLFQYPSGHDLRLMGHTVKGNH